uniref:Uncharacterized protein n=1 Tax=Solanum tuberosum TaxID=4113 RepID=M1D8I0_SOLTU
MVIPKTTWRATEWLFSSPKVPACQPWGRTNWRQKWGVSESSIDSAITRWIAQSHRTWKAEDQCKVAMEGSKRRITEPLGEARLIPPTGLSCQKVGNYKLDFKREIEEI